MSRDVSKERDSSIVIEPSWPTRSTAIEINFPIELSLFAEMAAMCSICSIVTIGDAISLSLPTTCSVQRCRPRCNSVGDTPARINFWDSLRMALASTVEVVVPSPASVFVWTAACLIICAPAFSNGSSRATKCATVTPSFVMKGIFPFSCSKTLLPFGPNVEATLSANISAPLIIFCCSVWLSEYFLDIDSSMLFFIIYLNCYNVKYFITLLVLLSL